MTACLTKEPAVWFPRLSFKCIETSRQILLWMQGGTFVVCKRDGEWWIKPEREADQSWDKCGHGGKLEVEPILFFYLSCSCAKCQQRVVLIRLTTLSWLTRFCHTCHLYAISNHAQVCHGYCTCWKHLSWWLLLLLLMVMSKCQGATCWLLMSTLHAIQTPAIRTCGELSLPLHMRAANERE